MQSTERPNDFKKDPIKDLLDTNSLGVPLEDKDFHKRIPKIEIPESPADEADKTNEPPKPRTTPKIIRGNNPNNAVTGLSSVPKPSSVFEKLDKTTKPTAKPSQDKSIKKLPQDLSIK